MQMPYLCSVKTKKQEHKLQIADLWDDSFTHRHTGESKQRKENKDMKTLRHTLAMLMILFTTAVASAQPMSYYSMRNNARFLTDRMAYTLGLPLALIDELYLINYDYICGVNEYLDDVAMGYRYDDYMEILYARDNALRRLLNEAQWARLMTYDYFYRPISFVNHRWSFSIYAYDRRPTYFYYGVPRRFNDYRGGHYFRGMEPRPHFDGRPAGQPRPGRQGDMHPGMGPGHAGPGNRPNVGPGNNRPGTPGARPGNDGNRPGTPGARPDNDGNRPGTPGAGPGNDGNRPGNGAFPGSRTDHSSNTPNTGRSFHVTPRNNAGTAPSAPRTQAPSMSRPSAAPSTNHSAGMTRSNAGGFSGGNSRPSGNGGANRSAGRR